MATAGRDVQTESINGQDTQLQQVVDGIGVYVDPTTGKYYAYFGGDTPREVSREDAERIAIERGSDGFLGAGDNRAAAQISEIFAGTDAKRAAEGKIEEGLQNVRPEQADVYADPYAVEAQKRALEGLAGYAQGGLRPEDKQAIQAGQIMQGQYLRGQREAALDQAEMRGMRGGQAQLASDIGAQQGLAQALFLQNADINNAASARALQALGMQGDVGRGMRQDSFSEGMTRAGAVDSWKQGEIAYARQQRDIARGIHQQAQQRVRDTPGATAEVGTALSGVVQLAGEGAKVAAGLPPDPNAVANGTQNLTNPSGQLQKKKLTDEDSKP
jgi:hypothetical protein